MQYMQHNYTDTCATGADTLNIGRWYRRVPAIRPFSQGVPAGTDGGYRRFTSPPPIVSFFHNCGVYSGALTQKLIATIISVRKDRVQEFASFNQNSKEGDRPADHSHAYGEYAGAYDPDFLDFDGTLMNLPMTHL